MERVHNKTEAIQAIKSVGMDDAFLDKAVSMLDHPNMQKLAFGASFLGVNINEVTENIRTKVNELKSSTAQPSPRMQTVTYKQRPKTNDSLAHLRAGLPKRK